MARLTKNERKSAAAGVSARFLVAGAAISETVTHGIRGPERRGIGGVAATIALALAEAGNEVTLVTSTGQGPEGRRARELLAETPIHTVIRGSQGPAGYAAMVTRQGEQVRANGQWPRQEGLSRLVAKEAKSHDCIIADCNMTPGELARILDQPGKLTMVNGSTAQRCRWILKAGPKELGMLTVNEAEAQAMMRAIPAVWKSKLMKRLNARAMLVTSGHNGWALYREGQETMTSPAVETPAHTDFIGCGDYAAAGAVHALAHGLDPELTINRFIRRKLEANAVRPGAGNPPAFPAPGLEIVPMYLTDACAFIERRHRHHPPPQGGLFAVGTANGGEVVGVAIVGRPVARRLQDGWTAEVTRLCVLDGCPNACSMLYAACWRAARALGWRRLITYTLPVEGGASLRGAGWRLVGERGGGTWDRKDRPRVDQAPAGQKWLWEAGNMMEDTT